MPSLVAERGERTPSCQLDLGAFRHVLVVFGGPQGLEYALEHDELASQHACPSELFERWGSHGTVCRVSDCGVLISCMQVLKST